MAVIFNGQSNKNQNLEPRLLNAKEAALYLGLHPQTVYDMAIAGHIPSFKLGRCRKFDKLALDEWIESKKEEQDD